ncbi:Ferredoxin--NADP reductase [compost metagenome]
MVQKGRITLHLGARVNEILDDSIRLLHADGSTSELDNDFVLALTGFRPDRKLLSSVGVEMSDDMDKPVYNVETMESSVPGVYVGGVIASGRNANEVFIESGRWHGKYIAEHIVSRQRGQAEGN